MPILEPSKMPLMGLPLELSDEAATELIDFLYALIEALEHHYYAQLIRYSHREDHERHAFDFAAKPDLNDDVDDPPF